MKQTNFLSTLQAVVDQANKFIETSVPEGKTIHLLPEEDEDDDEQRDNLPMVSRVDKYGSYEEYSVLCVSKKDKKTMLHLVGRGETTWEKKDVDFDTLGNFFQLSNDNVCDLADQISAQL